MIKRRQIILVILLALIAAYYYRVKIAAYSIDETQPYKVKWDAHGSANYTVTLSSWWPPGPAYDRVLVFSNKIFIRQERDAGCRLSPADFCDFSLSSPDQYAIPALFEEARQCINETKSAYVLLRPFSLEDFHGFDSLHEVTELLWPGGLLVGNPTLCVVHYDAQYGYPKDIAWYVPNASDGVGVMRITKLRILTEF